MANTNLTTNLPEIQTKTIEVAGRLHQIARVTDFCWVLTDLANGETKQFSSTDTMWQYIGTIKPVAVPNLSLPQLPARCPQHPSEKRAEWKRNQIVLMQYNVRDCYSVDFPIYLPATTTPDTQRQLPAPRIAGLLPAVAGLKPGLCDGFLNAHWSPLATDGMVFEHRGHQYCPHCFSAYHTAMDSIKAQKAA